MAGPLFRRAKFPIADMDPLKQPDDNMYALFSDTETEYDSEPERSSIPPTFPNPWTWICHGCGYSWRLGVTNRCLKCGHFYCSGFAVEESQSDMHCPSGFDYAAWHLVAAWKMERSGTRADRQRTGCETNCLFPTQCLGRHHHRRVHDAIDQCRRHYYDTLPNRAPV